MGCDIHLYAEKRVDGAWQSADAWEPNEYYDPEDPDSEEKPLAIPYRKRFYDSRNYDLFAMLANVRNGYRFAGCDTGDGFVPICEPKGLPDDVSPQVKADSDRWGSDGHSHSWLTVAELMAYDWTQTTKHRGWLNAVEFHRWDRWPRSQGEPPDEWCGGVSGPRISHVSEVEMKRRVDAIKPPEPGGSIAMEKAIKASLGDYYCLCEWTTPYMRSAREFLSSTMPRLWRLGAPEDVRIVFWFDN